MAKPKLTERVVNDLKATGHDYKVFDAQQPGFHVRVSPKGTRTYAVFYRNTEGQQRTIKLGRVGVLKCEKAREMALARLVEVQNGGDPSATRRAERAVVTMQHLYEDYLAKHARVRKRPRSVLMDEILWRLHLGPQFAAKRVDQVNRRDLDGFMAKMAAKKGAADRALALLSKMMSLAVDWELRPNNPCKGVKRHGGERKQRFLTVEEATRLHQALDAEEDLGGANAIRLLLWTGARRSEVLLAEWGQFNLSADAPVWVVPARNLKGATKTRADLWRPLSPEAVALLKTWQAESPVTSLRWTFPSPRNPAKARSDLKSTWNRVRKRAGLSDVRLHDLRHSFASALINEGETLFTVGKMLGHADVRTTERYAHLTNHSLRKAASAAARVYARP